MEQILCKSQVTNANMFATKIGKSKAEVTSWFSHATGF